MRISDWSSDVGSADLEQSRGRQSGFHKSRGVGKGTPGWSEGRGRDDFGSGAQVKPALVQLGKGRLKHAAGRPMKMMRSVGAERHGVDRKRVVYGKSVSVSVDLGGSPNL